MHNFLWFRSFQLYCHEVLHDHLLDVLTAVLHDCVAAIQHDHNQWMRLEACIYALYSIAEHIETDESKCLPKFITLLSEIPYEKLNEKLLGTALDSIGAYSEWFKENPTYLPHAIQIVALGLSSNQTAQATLGLKDLCRECQLQLRSYAIPLLQACQQAIVNGHLINTDSVRLMYSIGKLMSMLPQQSLLHWLDAVVSPCFTELQTLAQSRSVNESAKIRTIFRLNMISTLFSSLNTKIDDDHSQAGGDATQSSAQPQIQPVLFVMQKTMPIFKDVGTLWINEHTVIEGLCNTLKFAITNLLDDFKPMLPDLCNLIVSILQSKCVSPAVDIAKTVSHSDDTSIFQHAHPFRFFRSQAIILFYKDEQCQSIMRQLFVEVIVYNFQLFEQTADADLSNIADVLESFYIFNSLVAKKIPQAFADVNIDCMKLIHFGEQKFCPISILGQFF